MGEWSTTDLAIDLCLDLWYDDNTVQQVAMEGGMNHSEGDEPGGQDKRTIVGGRPRGRKPRGRIPRGIETLLKRAALDPDFRQRLLDQRGKAAGEIGLRLTMAETVILASVPRKQLTGMIDRMQVSEEERRVLLEQTSAAPDAPPDTAPATLGTRPEMEDDLEGELPPAPATRGIRPD
jgi:hypothetical protein